MQTDGLVFDLASLAYNVTAGARWLLAERLLHGGGMGRYPTAASAVVADLAPPDRRGAVMGTFGAAANIAMALGRSRGSRSPTGWASSPSSGSPAASPPSRCS